MACVYIHKRGTNGEIFYVGIGKKHSRASSNNRRNKYWHNIVNKHSYDVEIAYDNLSWKDAINFEIFLILLYGRKDLNKGTLCNMTDGGEGALGRKHTDVAKLKISKANKGSKRKYSPKWKSPIKYEILMMDVFK